LSFSFAGEIFTTLATAWISLNSTWRLPASLSKLFFSFSLPLSLLFPLFISVHWEWPNERSCV
jgi:hypothetical protein